MSARLAQREANDSDRLLEAVRRTVGGSEALDGAVGEWGISPVPLVQRGHARERDLAGSQHLRDEAEACKLAAPQKLQQAEKYVAAKRLALDAVTREVHAVLIARDSNRSSTASRRRRWRCASRHASTAQHVFLQMRRRRGEGSCIVAVTPEMMQQLMITPSSDFQSGNRRAL